MRGAPWTIRLMGDAVLMAVMGTVVSALIQAARRSRPPMSDALSGSLPGSVSTAAESATKSPATAGRPYAGVEVGDGPLVVGIVEVERHEHAVDQRLELGEAGRLRHAEPVGGREELQVAVRGGVAEGGGAVAVEDRPVARPAELALDGHRRAAPPRRRG